MTVAASDGRTDAARDTQTDAHPPTTKIKKKQGPANVQSAWRAWIGVRLERQKAFAEKRLAHHHQQVGMCGERESGVSVLCLRAPPSLCEAHYACGAFSLGFDRSTTHVSYRASPTTTHLNPPKPNSKQVHLHRAALAAAAAAAASPVRSHR